MYLVFKIRQHPQGNAELWESVNISGFLDFLVNNGHDVYVNRLHLPNGSLEAGGDALIEMIKYVNSLKEEDDHYENTIIGLSAGGQVAKYAITKMEYDHKYNGGPHHETKLYVSFDSPHRGAMVPLGTQLGIRGEDLIPRNAISHVLAKILVTNLRSGGAKDMMYYHCDNYLMGTVTVGAQEPTPSIERTNFLNTMEGFNPSSKYPGFPDDARNIAVVLGSNTSGTTNFSGGDILLKKIGLNINVWGIWDHKSTVKSAKYISSGLGARIYDRRSIFSPHFAPTPIHVAVHTYYGKNMYELDDCNGSYVPELHYGAVGAMSLDGFSALSPIPIVPVLSTPSYVAISDMPFLPVLSALSIKENNSLYPWNKDVSFNLHSLGLMFDLDEYGNYIPSNEIGYPRLNYPTNHFELTPFEAFFCDQKMNKHIKVAHSTDNMAKFLLEEITPYDLWFQNKKVGELSPSSYTYAADYESKISIVAGENVTYKTDVGPYILLPNSDVQHKAGEFIELKPGFEAQFGCVYDAIIGPMGCQQNWKASSSVENGESSKSSTIEYTMSGSDTVEESNKILIYPNPNKGEFVIKGLSKEGTSIEVFDLMGNLVLNKKIETKNEVVELPPNSSGLFLVKINSNSGEQSVLRVSVTN